MQPDSLARLRQLNQQGQNAGPDEGRPRTGNLGTLKIVTYGEAKAQLDAPYLVKGIVHPGELSAVIGAPGCGKTFLVTDMDAHIAADVDWFGHRVKQTAVVYLAAEGGTAILNRIAAIKARLGFDDSLPLAIIPASLDLISGSGDANALIETIGTVAARFGKPVGKVSIDTVSRVLAGGDENSPEDMGALIHNADRLREATNAHLMLVHHNTKEGGSGKGGRGHSSLWGALDTEIDVHRDPVTKIATATVYKQRNGPEGAKVAFELESVELGTDSDGDAVTSCVVRGAEGVAKAAGVKMSATCTIALHALRQAIDQAGEVPPANNHIPAGIRVTSPDLWRKFAYASSISSEGQEAKKKAFQRAAAQLQARGIVCAWQEYVWPA